MDNILIINLKTRVSELKNAGVREDAILNSLKEELQYYVLDYIYNSKKYSHLYMYGGSLLRIGYGLSRMSEDLDFQTAEKVNVKELKMDIITYFKRKYGQKIEVSISSRSKPETDLLKLRFNILGELGFENISWRVLRLRFDINYFKEANKFIVETIPVTKGNLSFNIKTYPISTLMANKILAVLRRKERGIAGQKSDCKPRDIYDLMWYMGRKTFPDLEYLKAKGEKFDNILDLYDKIKLRVVNLKDDLFNEDIAQFFRDPAEYNDWFVNWRTRFLNLINSYKMYKVGELIRARVSVEFASDNRYFDYIFEIENKDDLVAFRVGMSDFWYNSNYTKNIKGNRVKKAEKILAVAEDGVGKTRKLSNYDYEYFGVFYRKIIEFLRKNNNIVTQNEFKTRLIRTTADNLDPKKQIWLDNRLLQKIEFEELL